MKYLGWLMVPLFLCILCTAGVYADIRPPNTPETQFITTFTSVETTGIFIEGDSLVWRQSNEVLDANLMEVPVILFDPEGIPITVIYTVVQSPEPPLQFNEIQITSSLNENTLADQGETIYTKQSSLDTSWKPDNMFNVEQQKAVHFTGSDTGRIFSEESSLVDAAGKSMTTLGQSIGLCPFTNIGIGNCVPPFCNIVEMGSSIDMREVQFSTDIESRTIAQLAIQSGSPSAEAPAAQISLPVIDGAPTELNYAIDVSGAGQNPAAIGNVEAYMNAHFMDARGCLSLDMVYHEKTTASGLVKQFQKSMSYESGIRNLACGT